MEPLLCARYYVRYYIDIIPFNSTNPINSQFVDEGSEVQRLICLIP